MIMGFVSGMGTGKTLAAIREATLKFPNKKIITNIKLSIPHQYLTFDTFVEWYSKTLKYSEVERNENLKKMFKDKIWIADEMHNLVNARDFNNKKFNLNVTQFFTMLGKLNCYVIYTAQLFESQIDIRIREFTNIIAVCEKLDQNFNPVIYEDRISKQKRFIKITYNIKVRGSFIEYEEAFDPEPYFKLYDTHQLIITDRKS